MEFDAHLCHNRTVKGERLTKRGVDWIVPVGGIVVYEEARYKPKLPSPTVNDLPKRRTLTDAEVKELTEQVD